MNVQSKDIGVISPYRSQVKLLQQKKKMHPDLAEVEINTVDQYQGRDKSLIVVSFVYSGNGNVSDQTDFTIFGSWADNL